MGDISAIPTFGFARGAVVRSAPDGPNMLVVRGLGERTAVIVIESDAGGAVRLRDVPTAGLYQVLPAQTPQQPDTHNARTAEDRSHD